MQNWRQKYTKNITFAKILTKKYYLHQNEQNLLKMNNPTNNSVPIFESVWAALQETNQQMKEIKQKTLISKKMIGEISRSNGEFFGCHRFVFR